ncbi:hypothetical protein [Paenibacillus campinasensis]
MQHLPEAAVKERRDPALMDSRYARLMSLRSVKDAGKLGGNT